MQTRGFTLIELTIALAISSVLILGTVTLYAHARASYDTNEALARMQETAMYAFSAMEADIRLAGYWGLTNNARPISGTMGNAPLSLPKRAAACGSDFVLDLTKPVAGSNDSYSLTCTPTNGALPGTDSLFVRHADPQAERASAERLQVYSTREGSGAVFLSNTAPGRELTDPIFGPSAEVHNLIARAYYVSRTSTQQPGLPCLRRKTLQAGPSIGDEEIICGVEDLQLQFGIGTRYAEPDDPVLADAQIRTVRVSISIRGEAKETGLWRMAFSRTFFVPNAAGNVSSTPPSEP